MHPFHPKKLKKLAILHDYKHHAKLCKVSNDAYNCGGFLILQHLLNERVAEGDAYDPQDFTAQASILQQQKD